MKVAIAKETFPGERRVAMIPANVPPFIKAGVEVIVEPGAGAAAGFLDQEYLDRGATLAASRNELFSADVLLQVRCLGANPDAGRVDLALCRPGQTLIGMCDPLGNPQAAQELAETGVSLFGLELIPRITRAQSMDVLSAMATIAGYRAVLLAAIELPKMFPLMMTAAGTLKPAHVFVIGAGVAGLQAIATAKRLGAVVSAYDLRPACREQVESLGGRFVELELETASAEDKGGYAKAMDDDFYQKQRALMAKVVAESDVVITTAAIPGKTAPLLITADAVSQMEPGSVILDLAAERGGNVEPSLPDERVLHHNVLVLGPTNLASEIPYHASQMYSNNISKFLLNLLDGDHLKLNFQDEIIRDTLVAHHGQIYNARMREALGLEPLEPLGEPESPNVDPRQQDTIKVEGLLSEEEDAPSPAAETPVDEEDAS
ncbi:Re/Si-specific NAD(P)(+) transhydrogenase subunit alpha [Lignipirellula cremea]|uniref:proton-translocating NAD(P)(+) transhydrogenase n=1 Tax=Lignipirellula cremea TaxID=2528010 RepID=A0A518DLV4_9BACT|nr:Re/Si-specific NAD(P)(+) transhydrogenase subunit alpha [Lignipirellula cremea]QDU92828.1 NAD(P) transhydrogenase subunit alpha part 1 [Lignipirellula cremea]